MGKGLRRAGAFGLFLGVLLIAVLALRTRILESFVFFPSRELLATPRAGENHDEDADDEE